MSVLSNVEIKKMMREPDYDKKLLITPLLSESQIGPASVDVRLGTSIIVPRKTYVDNLDVTKRELIRQVEHRGYSSMRLKFGSKFILHPHEVILAVTLEYIGIPANVFATIASRSSWGRLGLVVATAAGIQPGYKGCLTLELVNLGESPIVLYPGLLVGQLVFFENKADQDVPQKYEGRYQYPTDAGLPNFFYRNSDTAMEFWANPQ